MRIMCNQKQWQTIVEEQQASGLTIVDYCQKNELSTTTFYAARKKLGLSTANFVRAKITQQMEIIQESSLITIAVGKATVSLPVTTSATYLSQLLREFVR